MFTTSPTKPTKQEKVKVKVYNCLKRMSEEKEAVIIAYVQDRITCKLSSGVLVNTDIDNVRFLK